MRFINILHLQLAHAIESGAYYAFKGHAEALGCREIRAIAYDEFDHMMMVRIILFKEKSGNNRLFDFIISIIGMLMGKLCKIFPNKSLDWIAYALEIVNITSYDRLKVAFPEYKVEMDRMIRQEKEHEIFFKKRLDKGRKAC